VKSHELPPTADLARAAAHRGLRAVCWYDGRYYKAGYATGGERVCMAVNYGRLDACEMAARNIEQMGVDWLKEWTCHANH